MTGQGNDDLGIGKVEITYTDLGEDGDQGAFNVPASVKVAPNEVASFCAHLAGEGGCIDILVNGMSEYDYLKQVKGLPDDEGKCCGQDLEPTDTEGHSYTCSICGRNSSIYIDDGKSSMSDNPLAHMFEASLDGCNIEDQHGEPYCHTHKCGPTDPCIVKGCPHCVGEQEAAYNTANKADDIGG